MHCALHIFQVGLISWAVWFQFDQNEKHVVSNSVCKIWLFMYLNDQENKKNVTFRYTGHTRPMISQSWVGWDVTLLYLHQPYGKPKCEPILVCLYKMQSAMPAREEDDLVGHTILSYANKWSILPPNKSCTVGFTMLRFFINLFRSDQMDHSKKNEVHNNFSLLLILDL